MTVAELYNLMAGVPGEVEVIIVSSDGLWGGVKSAKLATADYSSGQNRPIQTTSQEFVLEQR